MKVVSGLEVVATAVGPEVVSHVGQAGAATVHRVVDLSVPLIWYYLCCIVPFSLDGEPLRPVFKVQVLDDDGLLANVGSKLEKVGISFIRAVNERVCDVEALARWVDPVKGVLSPADFIPALEDAGLIYKLDLYMVDQVLNAIKAWEESGFRAVPHSINLSRSDFDSCDIVEEIRKRVDEAGVSRNHITIEITDI